MSFDEFGRKCKYIFYLNAFIMRAIKFENISQDIDFKDKKMR